MSLLDYGPRGKSKGNQQLALRTQSAGMTPSSTFICKCLATVLSLATVSSTAPQNSPTQCTYLPTDERWPTVAEWTQLNNTVGGQLIATVPQASVCHTAPYRNYDVANCVALAAGWNAAQTFEPWPAEMMNAYYQNRSCDPFTATSQPCELGNYASYSIKVSSAEDVIAGIEFAKAKNVRLVVKTTGHDYVGRSSGRGTLSLWTWNLKTAEIVSQYQSNWYTGPAMKLGSGMIVGDATTVAHAAGYRVVGGECGSVGIASGYSQGGGHSMLNSAYGMASDQVLEWEVVTPEGEHVVASPERNSDLYWALSGGGGGTFGIVLSSTVRIHPDGPIAGGTLSFSNTNDTVYWQAVEQWLKRAPEFVDQNNTIIFLILDHAFEAVAITLPDQPESAVAELLTDFTEDLKRVNIPYALNTTYSNSYLDHFQGTFGPLPYGPNNPTTILMNRIVPRNVIESESLTTQLVNTFRETVATGEFLVGCLLTNVTNAEHPDNAVLPAWRDSAVACNVNAYWNYTAPLSTNIALKRKLADVHMPAIEAASPAGGVYMNEMDPFYRGDWKTSLFGANYEKLLVIKHKYDPQHVLWGGFTVGSDEMIMQDDGKLCRV